MNHRLSIIAYFIFVFISNPMYLAIAEEQSEIINIKTTQITSDIEQQAEPRIWGDNIVWIETPSTTPPYSNREVKLHNINSNNTIQITNVTNEYEDHRGVDVQGNWIVWWIKSAYPTLEPRGLFIYNISTGLTNQIAENYWPWLPKIYGDNIVFNDGTMLYVNQTMYNETGDDIGIYNIKTQQVTIICNATGHQTNPDIWENYIVWEDFRNGQSDIYLFDLNTMKEKQITNTPENETLTRIFGNYIGWFRIGGYIDIYNISKNQIIHTFEGADFTLNNDIVIIENYSTHPSILYNLSSEKEYSLGTSISYSGGLDLSNNKLVYKYDYDIYLLEFTFTDNGGNGNNTNGTDDGRGHNGLTIPSATMSFLVMAIIIIAVVRRRRG